MSKVRLIHDDSLSVLPTLESGSVDAVVTDPMFGIGKADLLRNGNHLLRRNFFQNDNEETGISVLEDCAVRLQVKSIFTYCGHRQFGRIVDMLERNGFRTGFFVWTKTNSAPSVRKYLWRSCAELAVWGLRGGAFQWNGDAHGQNWRQLPCCTFGHPEKNGHPTQKPLKTMLPAVLAVPPGDTILDPFMGSGTTGVGCIQTGRSFIGIEISPEFFAIAEKRIRRAQEEVASEAAFFGCPPREAPQELFAHS